jgi:chromosome partitioning protein
VIVWTIANQKGGVGKTTTVVTLAGWLSQQGHRVLLIDTDPHASLTSYMGYDSDELYGTLYELFKDPRPSRGVVARLTLKTQFANISLIPASITLATLDRTLGNKEGMGLILSRALQCVKDLYDYVLIDSPPVLGVMMINAMAASDRIIVPVQTEFLAQKGLDRMVKTFSLMQRSRPGGFRYTIVPTMFDRRTKASMQTLESIKEVYGDSVWGAVIPVDTKFRDASLEHMPLSMIAPESRGSQAYASLLKYVQQLDRKLEEERNI